MADYNVNMKQWNGSSFDNVLPLAFNSKALEGKSYDDIIQYAKSRDLLLYTGQYTGTGTYGSRNPNSITFPFEPILAICPSFVGFDRIGGVLDTFILPALYDTVYWYVGNPLMMMKNGNTVSWYNTSSAYNQLNDSGRIYYYAAIGGYDMGGQIPVGRTYTITFSQTWKVPATGKWMLELYGKGGTAAYFASGGASCQHYDSITLTKGNTIQIVIGNDSNPATKFGDYSVDNAGNADSATPGTGTGNRGRNGLVGGASVYGTGEISSSYGYGGGNGANGGPGAVYLKYLGE